MQDIVLLLRSKDCTLPNRRDSHRSQQENSTGCASCQIAQFGSEN